MVFEDEKVYLARVVDAYRGNSLGNAYLAEHQSAERFMPELAERLLAFLARAAGPGPLVVVAVSRVLFPVLIYVLLWSVARALGMEPRWATLAALLAPLRPTVFRVSYDPGFFRYARAVSPAFYVLLLLVALRAVQLARTRGEWWAGLPAGASLGFLFYGASVYYWTFAIGGVAWMAFAATGRVRSALLTSLGTALLVGAPFFAETFHRGRVPDVRATLARLNLLTPGRAPDVFVTRVFVIAVLVLVVCWLWRRKLGDSGRFLFPFMCVGTLFMVQNVVTNRHLQGWHWVDCLLPIWSLAAVVLMCNSRIRLRPGIVTALMVVWVATALVFQAAAYRRWVRLENQDPAFWALDARMPRTLEWLNQHTPANSVVVTAPDVADSLVLFTHNRVYWAYYASESVVPDWEVDSRLESVESWRPDSGVRLPFRADFYLGSGATCSEMVSAPFLYQNPSEQTCVLPASGRS